MRQNDVYPLRSAASYAFHRPIRRIVYCYGQPQRCFKDMQREGIHFHMGIPKNIQSLFPKDLRPGILVLDDLMRDCSEDQHVLDLFTKGSHHNDVTRIYLTQNLFPSGKYHGPFPWTRTTWWPSKTHVMLWVFATWRSRRTLDASRLSWTFFCSLIFTPSRPIYFVFEQMF